MASTMPHWCIALQKPQDRPGQTENGYVSAKELFKSVFIPSRILGLKRKQAIRGSDRNFAC